MGKKKIKEKLKALEEIINAHSITLTDPTDPNHKIVIDFNGTNLSTINRNIIITDNSTNVVMETIENLS